MQVTVAACQLDVSSSDMEKNIASCESAVKRAKEKGAVICVLPELAVTGYETPCYTPEQARKAASCQARFAALAKYLGVHVFVGSLCVDKGLLRNTLLYFSPDGLQGPYFKNELVAHENLFAVPGDRPVIYQTPFGRIGCAICKDMLYKSVFVPYRGAVDLMVIGSAWPDFSHLPQWGWLKKAAAHNEELVRTLPGRIARYVGAPVVYCDSWGGPHRLFGIDTWMLGASSIFMPQGLVAQGSTQGEDMLVAAIEVEAQTPWDDGAPWPDKGPLSPALKLEHALYKTCGAIRRILRTTV